MLNKYQRFHIKHRDRILARKKAFREKNRERINKADKEYYYANRERILLRRKEIRDKKALDKRLDELF